MYIMSQTEEDCNIHTSVQFVRRKFFENNCLEWIARRNYHVPKNKYVII